MSCGISPPNTGNMRIILGCEASGVVRSAFRDMGHDAWSCDLRPAEDDSPYHIQDDVLLHLQDGWDMGIFFPECTYLAVSGLHWNKRNPERAEKTHEAILFFMSLADAPIPRIAIENPVGCMSTHYRKPDQIIQPWQFGSPYSKKTCLWLKNIPKLVPTFVMTPTRFQANGKPRWANQTPTGQNNLGPSKDRKRQRALTFPGIGTAMGEQWGSLEAEFGLGIPSGG